MKPFRPLTVREKLIEVLRWFCVLPGVLVAWIIGNRVGSLLARSAMTVGLIPGDQSWGSACARYLLWLFPDGMACIVAGAAMAPRCRIVIACLVAMAWALMTDMIHDWTAYTIIPTTVTAMSGVFLIHRFEKSQNAIPEAPAHEHPSAL